MKTIITIFLIVLTVECSSQIMEEPSYINQVWKAEYNGTANESDDLVAIATDNAGNVFVTGLIEENGNYSDWATIKYNPSGVRQWVAKYNNGDADRPSAIAVDNSGNVYVTGESYSESNDYLTIKYSSNGVKQWERRFGGTGEDIPYDIAVDANNNVYVTGSAVHGTGNSHCVTIKYNSAGDLQWEADYQGSYGGDEKGLFIEFGRNGAVYIAGVTQNTQIYKDILLIKYNTSGEEHWVQTYDGAGHGHDIITKMVVGGENQHIFLSGYTYGGETTGRDYLTMKYNGLGQRLWAKTYNGPANEEDRAVSLAVDEDGNSYVTGYSKSHSTGFDYATIKYDNAGNQQWLKRVDGGSSFDEYARDIAMDESGYVYVTGVFEQTTENYQLATIKYTPSGTQKWIKKFVNATGKVSEGHKIVLDGSKNIFIGGSIDVSGANNGDYRNFLVVKYSQSQYIIVNRTEIPNTFSLSQNYPNPFNPVTNISFDIPNASNVKLTVFDITGREIEQLVNNQLEAGTYNIDFDASHLATGTYFYRINAGDFTEVKKMILIK